MPSAGLEICKVAEGYATALPNGDCVAYFDRMGNVYTIGFGVTGQDVQKGTRWTRQYADERLQVEWEKHQRGVLRASPVLLKHPNQLDAVTDFAYNLGVGRYQASTLRRYIDQQRRTEAAAEFRKWNLAGGKVQTGLVLRRQKERMLFLQPDIPSPDSKSSDTELADLSESRLPEFATPSPERTNPLPEAPQLSREAPSFATRLGSFFRSLW